jgi:hypothetical protein
LRRLTESGVGADLHGDPGSPVPIRNVITTSVEKGNRELTSIISPLIPRE